MSSSSRIAEWKVLQQSSGSECLVGSPLYTYNIVGLHYFASYTVQWLKMNTLHQNSTPSPIDRNTGSELALAWSCIVSLWLFYDWEVMPVSVNRDALSPLPAVDFFNQINMLYGTITEFCTEGSCAVMSAGPRWGTPVPSAGEHRSSVWGRVNTSSVMADWEAVLCPDFCE